MTLSDPRLCAPSRGGLNHPWDVIPVEYEPNCSVWDYVDILNMRCARCGRIKALLYDAAGDYLTRYKSGTGVLYSDGEIAPDRDDLRAMLFARVRSIEDRNTQRAAKRTAPADKPSKRQRQGALTAVA